MNTQNLISKITSMEEEAKSKGQILTVLCLYPTDQDNQTVKETVTTFKKVFTKVRYHLRQHSIESCGLTVTEPMKNGVPKFFVMIFSDPKNDNLIREITNHCFSNNNFSLKLLAAHSPLPQTEAFIDKRHHNPSLERILSWCRTHQIRPATFFGRKKTAI